MADGTIVKTRAFVTHNLARRSEIKDIHFEVVLDLYVVVCVWYFLVLFSVLCRTGVVCSDVFVA